MPQVHHVKHARKARKQYGIKKGDSYFWWKHRRKGSKNGYKCYSRTKPRRSQLTLSDYYRTAYTIEEGVEDAVAALADFVDESEIHELAATIRGAADEVRQLEEEQQAKFDNLPESFRYGPSGDTLEGREECCANLATALEQAADELESLEIGDDTPAASSDVTNIVDGISWNWEL